MSAKTASKFRSGKSQNESSPNFSNFCPGFCPEFLSEFFPNFLSNFRASFRGKRRPEKIHQKSPPFFNAKFPGKYGKKIHKMFLERRQSNKSWPEQEEFVSHRRCRELDFTPGEKILYPLLRWAKSRDPNRESLAIKKRAIRIAGVFAI